MYICIDGTLCKHQAAVIMKTRAHAVNAVPTTAYGRAFYAKVALGDQAKEARFFVALTWNRH